jgi:hypothetical protein
VHCPTHQAVDNASQSRLQFGRVGGFLTVGVEEVGGRQSDEVVGWGWWGGAGTKPEDNTA